MIGFGACEMVHVPFKSRVYLLQLSGSLEYNPAGFQMRCFWGLVFWGRTLGLGSLMWGLDPSILEEDLYNCDSPPICDSSP